MTRDDTRFVAGSRIRLATVALYGDPSPSEPLERALERALDRLFLGHEPDDMVTDRLRARVIAGLPGDSEEEKLDIALADAPGWLVRGLHNQRRKPDGLKTAGARR